MASSTLTVTIFTIFFTQTLFVPQGYYWQNYDFDHIPSDALVGGEDSNGNEIYIGQAYVHGEGLMAVQINPGEKEVYATVGGVHKLKDNVKILRGDPSNFYWMPTNCTLLHDELNKGKKAVRGGHEDDSGDINIGRVVFEGGHRIGKVNTFQLNGDSFFFFVNEGVEKLLLSYEILMLKDSNSESKKNAGRGGCEIEDVDDPVTDYPVTEEVVNTTTESVFNTTEYVNDIGKTY